MNTKHRKVISSSTPFMKVGVHSMFIFRNNIGSVWEIGLVNKILKIIIHFKESQSLKL